MDYLHTSNKKLDVLYVKRIIHFYEFDIVKLYPCRVKTRSKTHSDIRSDEIIVLFSDYRPLSN